MVMCTYTFNTPKTEEKLQVHDQPELYNKIQYQIMKKFQMTNVMLYFITASYTGKEIINLNDQQREKN